ncbi:MAG: ABC transporter permease [Desulfofustis sp.]|nr:ABC transporter permease [Desulfofustis sp.]NNF45362.1 ABC transporter permease [Desulfofustis sp.]
MASLQRIWVIFRARNKEFFRDRAAFGWNFAFPFLIILGFGIIFSGETFQRYKIGVFPQSADRVVFEETHLPSRFQTDPALDFIAIASLEEGLIKIGQHKIDLLIDGASADRRYWVNDASPKGRIVEQLYQAALIPRDNHGASRIAIDGTRARYIDWFFPGIMAMNMMFSALWGVGYVVVRYRKNGALKRLKATPLTAFEYLSAQMLSRIFLLMFTFSVVWFGSDLIFDFRMQGSLLLFLFTFFLGGLSLCSMGLFLAARGISEEFTSGALNFISWPMMFLSEVWFSLEGAPQWVQQLSWLFPLTHLLKAARKVMNEGGTLIDIQLECGLMIFTTMLFLLLSARIFSWVE